MKKRIEELVEKLNEASKAYYQQDREIMSNQEYDALYDELVALEKETGIAVNYTSMATNEEMLVKLEEADCPMKVQLQLEMAVEEIFVNIASYAYTPGTGDMAMKVEIVKEPLPAAVVTIMDTGVPFNPLAKADPDVTLSAEERKIGGLGIFMVKKAMDDLTYEYRNGQNTLILKKYLP